jgi:hypothetical protein
MKTGHFYFGLTPALSVLDIEAKGDRLYIEEKGFF